MVFNGAEKEWDSVMVVEKETEKLWVARVQRLAVERHRKF